MITGNEEVQKIKELEEAGVTSPVQITYLPFYSSAAVFTVLNFLVYGAFICIRNFIRYMRFGVFSTNDYYTQE